jgi:hypothetical protein
MHACPHVPLIAHECDIVKHPDAYDIARIFYSLKKTEKTAASIQRRRARDTSFDPRRPTSLTLCDMIKVSWRSPQQKADADMTAVPARALMA